MRLVATAFLARLFDDPAALHDLGRIYSRGLAGVWDAEEAVQCFRRAAEAGHAPSQLELALAYSRGIGAPLDHSLAEHWLLAAVDQEYAPALDLLLRWWG